ncbi:MAG: hypothetical protein ACO1PW_06170 [Actinomycetota bacterium]
MSQGVLFLCTGNAARSVMAGAALAAHLPHWFVATAGTLVVEGQPMSWRTRAALEHVGLEASHHRSRQADPAALDQAALVVGLAPEHVQWVRRTHPSAAAHTGTLRRLARDLPADERPLAARVAELGLAEAELEAWEEVVDPGGGDAEAFTACAVEVTALVAELARRLDLSAGSLEG